MSSRSSRPRNGPTKDDGAEHEEQQMWNSIKDSLKRLATNQKRQLEITEQIEELEKESAERDKNEEGGATVQEIEAIQKLYREQLKLAADERRALKEEPHDIIKNLEILRALRKASSEIQSLPAGGSLPRRKVKPLNKPSSSAAAAAAAAASSSSAAGGGSTATASTAGGGGGGGSGSGGGTTGTSSSAGNGVAGGGASSSSGATGGGAAVGGGSGSGGAGRDRGSGNRDDDDASSSTAGGNTAVGGHDGPSDTPGPSLGPGRLKAGGGRSASVASRREATVDPEDTGRGANAERAGKLVKGAEVAYKQARPREDGSQWIVCVITAVVVEKGGGGGSSSNGAGSGNNNESGSGGSGGQRRYEVQDTEPEENGGEAEKYLAAARDLIAIPGPKESLPDYPVGKQVLARYPETTTFYSAEVLGTRKEKASTFCRLRFEDDQNQESEVLRRYVLDVGSK